MKGYYLDTRKRIRSEWDDDASRAFVYLGKFKKTKDGLKMKGHWFLNGTVLTPSEVRKYGVTKKQKDKYLVKVNVDKNDIHYENFDGLKQKRLFDTKPKIIDSNYEPSRFNSNEYERKRK